MSQLPPTWIMTSLGLICGNGQYGWTTKATNKGTVRFLRTTDITKGKIDWVLVPYCQDKPLEFEKYKIQKNDILISRSGSVGFSTLIQYVPFPTVFASYLIRYSPHNNIEARYVAYFLKSSEYWQQIYRVSTGNAMPNVNAKKLAEIRIPLAPLGEQKRIADKLDKLFARIDACCDRLAKIPQIIEQFRQSVLADAMSGYLTEDWRKKVNRSLDSWKNQSGDEVFSLVTSGSRSWANYYADTGAIFLRVGNLNHNTIEIDLQEIQYVNPPIGAEGKRTRLKVSDILISITADLGMVGCVREDIGEAYINQHLCLARQTGEYCSSFLAYYLASPLGSLKQLTKIQRGVTKPGLTLSDIRSIVFSIPELDEQEEIVRHIDRLFAYADLVKINCQNALEKVEELKTLILDQAFRGELVPQDPNDEPASVLLERIRAEQLAQPPRPKRIPIRKSAMTKQPKESLKEIIQKLPKDRLLFDDLREQFLGNYDLLKNTLFDILDEAEPIVKQVFDREKELMYFIREQK